MIVLGYSGLDSSLKFTRQNPDLRPGEERMIQGMDSAAVILVDGDIIAAAEEERFSGEKHTNRFPKAAIDFCLDQAGVSVDDIDFVAHGFNYRAAAAFYRKFELALYENVYDPAIQRALCSEKLGLANCDEKFSAVGHHLAHGASAYFPSGFDQALCVVCDGMGELESLTVFEVTDGNFKRLTQLSIPNSIGILYSLVTVHLGFKFNADEYKLMGLAPYGNSKPYRDYFDSIVKHEENGKFTIDYDSLIGGKDRDPHYRDVLTEFGKLITTPAAVETMEQRHYDFAAAAQDCLERALLHSIGYWQKETGIKRLCMAGGVALNCTLNGKLIESKLFDEIFIQPAAGDDGTALGAALFVANQKGDGIRTSHIQSMPFYGPSSGDDEILRAIDDYSEHLAVAEFDDIEKAACDAAQGVAGDLVQAWFQGNMEFGPRALGNRTILANPATPDIKSRVNMIVKLREGFRPFAPAVNIEHAEEYFDIDTSASPFEFMLATCQVKPQWQEKLPGITHVDGSARVQTVRKDKNPGFHYLINEIGKRTGIYCTLNTSFNVMSQPMIASASTAIQTFLKVELDRLYLGRFRLSKP